MSALPLNGPRAFPLLALLFLLLVQPHHLSLAWSPIPSRASYSSFQKAPLKTDSDPTPPLLTSLQGSHIPPRLPPPWDKSPSAPCSPQGPARPVPVPSLPSPLAYSAPTTRPRHYFSNMPGLILSRGLCTGCVLCLEHSSISMSFAFLALLSFC